MIEEIEEVEELDDDWFLDLVTTDICENSANTQYQCLECQLELDSCTCILDLETTHLDLFCTACNTSHMEISVEGLLANEIAFDETPDEPSEPSAPKYSYTDKCRHFNVALEFPDGTTVYASSKHYRKPKDVAPDFGLYLDSGWKPACPAYLVAWVDYGLPVYHEAAAKAIIDVYNKARQGMWVEVGCIGGHGRTGTALACMGVLSGLSPDDAVEFVRKNYCDHTVETTSQEWYVKWFAAYVHGTKSPKLVEKSHYKDEADTVYPSRNFKTPLDWAQYNVTDNPLGTPPQKICGTVRDRYVTVSYKDGNGKYKSLHIEDDDEQFQYVYELAMEQKNNPPKPEPTLKDLIGLEEPF